MPRPKTLAELNKTNLELAKADPHLAFTTYPEFLYPVFLRPCTVSILMVTDGGGSFTDADFGLTELLKVLAVSPGPFVRFAVTKAHRRTGGTGADIDNFRFDTTDLSSYDQIWMIAVERGSGSITAAELRSISDFMDAGGGVFATGDHEDLGVVMCGKIPRVRSMRRWHWPSPGPNGEPVAPHVDGLLRHDTNEKGYAAPTEFDDQSDDIPQTIRPKLYFTASPFFFREYVYPHPVLCGPKGVIRHLPDHPHEGDCYVPSDLTKTFTFSGKTFTEYPALAGGSRLAPEVIAWSSNGPGISDASKGTVSPLSFGAIGAYDGHQVNVGRVVVDATWHHFFNINLKGDPSSPDPAKRNGFYASSPNGTAEYAEIKAYFRNIAVWLATPERHRCMRWRALWASRWYSRLLMDFRPYKSLADIPLVEFIRLGTVARDVLGRLASQCQSLQWIFDWIIDLQIRPELLRPVHPWPPQPDPPPDPAPEFDPVLTYYAHALVNASLGAILYTLADRHSNVTEALRKRLERGEDRSVIEEGVKLGTGRVFEAARASRHELETLLKLAQDRSS